MRFTSFFVAGAFATMAAAQSATLSLTPAQKSQADCLDACEAGDVKCQSYCITVPSPNEENINRTTTCVSECDQGNGSEAATEKYSVCLQNCIADNYWKSVDGTPRETGAASNRASASASAAASATGTASDEDNTASASATGSASDSDSTGASETESESESASGTATGTASESTETGNAAPVLVGGVSFLGLAAAVLAL